VAIEPQVAEERDRRAQQLSGAGPKGGDAEVEDAQPLEWARQSLELVEALPPDDGQVLLERSGG
jgi:hypothetical protein